MGGKSAKHKKGALSRMQHSASVPLHHAHLDLHLLRSVRHSWPNFGAKCRSCGAKLRFSASMRIAVLFLSLAVVVGNVAVVAMVTPGVSELGYVYTR